MGQQKISAYLSILSILVLLLPLGCFFAFYLDMDIYGLWLGYLIRAVIIAILYSYILWVKFDWNEIAREAKEREENIIRKNSVEEGLKLKDDIPKEEHGRNSYGTLSQDDSNRPENRSSNNNNKNNNQNNGNQ